MGVDECKVGNRSERPSDNRESPAMFTKTDGPFRIEIVTEDDDTYLPVPDGDGYTPKQVKAYQAGDWRYVVLHGRVMIGDVKIAEDYFGGVEAGWFVMTDEQDNVTGEEMIDPLIKIDEWYSDFVDDLIDAARAALQTLADQSAQLATEESEAIACGLSHGWDAQNYADAYGSEESISDQSVRRARELYSDHTVAREAYLTAFRTGAEHYRDGRYFDGSLIEG
jgi:hypothetical protein